MNENIISDLLAKMEILTQAVLSNKPVLTLEEASAYTGLSTSSIYKLTSTQEIPHYKPRGKMLYFKRDELDAWLLQHRVRTNDETIGLAMRHVGERSNYQA